MMMRASYRPPEVLKPLEALMAVDRDQGQHRDLKLLLVPAERSELARST